MDKYLAVVVFTVDGLIVTRAFFVEGKNFDKELELHDKAVKKLTDEDDDIGVNENTIWMVLWYRDKWLNEGFKLMPEDADKITT